MTHHEPLPLPVDQTRLHVIVHGDSTMTWWYTDLDDEPITKPTRTHELFVPLTHDTVEARYEP